MALFRKSCIEWSELEKAASRVKSLEPHLKDHQVWERIMLTQKEGIMNTISVLQIALLLPVHSAERNKRGFFLVKRVKSDWRSRLSAETVTDPMTLELRGIQADINRSISDWWLASGKSERRPEQTPYGSRSGRTKEKQPSQAVTLILTQMRIC